MQKFTVTEQHLKLLKKMNVGWDNCEFGAPCINPKRPYGNSSVLVNMADILEMDLFKDEYGEKYITENQENELTCLHRDMETVLQIVLATETFEAGDYHASDYSRNWTRVRA